MTNRSETFGRLLKAGISSIVNCEGKKAPIIEDELGQLIGVSGDSIQRYKAGHLPPEPRTVQILAEAAILRGFLGREWLQRFLHAARYPFADKLLDQLCPLGPARSRPPRIYENLPAPTYSQFVMREQAFAEVIDGLGKRSAAVLIVGLGGNGKTSLAREVVSACLAGGDAPQFDAAVWVSDKDRPGTTNLSTVLDEIARTLDYPGFTQFEHEEKRREVEQLLRRQRVILVVDNFETITDGALLSWLLSLPEPSKALITTREYRRDFRRSSWPVDLRGMTEAEAKDLIAERVRVLKIEKFASDLAQMEPLLAATGGNPKALEMTLGLIKYERRPFQQVVDDLYAARGELFDDLFMRAWALLEEAARRVLLVMTFFPTNASAEALSVTADVQGFAFNRAVERLTDLALLDMQQKDLSSVPRYMLHPLVRAFASGQLVEIPAFETTARQRWVKWYIDLVLKVRDTSQDLARLEALDDEDEAIYSLANWVYERQWFAEAIQISDTAGHYYYVRGPWDRKRTMNLIHIDSARSLCNTEQEIRGLSYLIQLFSVQGNIAEVEKYLPRLYLLSRSLSDKTFFVFHNTIAHYNMAKQDVDKAQMVWQKSLDYAVERSDTSHWIANCLWIATCLRQKRKLPEAHSILLEAIDSAKKYNYERLIISCEIELIMIKLIQRDVENAAALLSATSAMAHRYQDRVAIATLQHLSARLHILRNDLPAARASLAEAIDLFERLGMRRELAEARTALADLDAREATEVAV